MTGLKVEELETRECPAVVTLTDDGRCLIGPPAGGNTARMVVEISETGYVGSGFITVDYTLYNAAGGVIESKTVANLPATSTLFTGTDGADVYVNHTALPEYADGRGGHDLLSTGYGDTYTAGGAGNDTVYVNAASGNVTVEGEGVDTVYSYSSGPVHLWGTSGVDTFAETQPHDVTHWSPP